MRVLRALLIFALLAALSGCACWKKRVGPAENIPLAAAGEVLADIYFDYDSYSVNAQARETLLQAADWFKANPSATVKIEGHCDERGTAEYNLALGQHRAEAARNYLRSLGVEDMRMSTISYGKELPLDPAHDEAAWAKNRRDHFAVTQ